MVTQPKQLNRRLKGRGGFTLAELLIALMVTAIILSAVASLASAMGSANSATKEMGRNQTILRSASIRLAEIIRYSKLICATPGNDVVIWKADDDNDNEIGPGEILYIESGSQRDYVRILEFTPKSNWLSEWWFDHREIDIDDIESGVIKDWLKFWFDEQYATLVPECENVQFLTPRPRFLTVSFDFDDNGLVQNYQINGALRVE